MNSNIKYFPLMKSFTICFRCCWHGSDFFICLMTEAIVVNFASHLFDGQQNKGLAWMKGSPLFRTSCQESSSKFTPQIRKGSYGTNFSTSYLSTLVWLHQFQRKGLSLFGWSLVLGISIQQCRTKFSNWISPLRKLQRPNLQASFVKVVHLKFCKLNLTNQLLATNSKSHKVFHILQGGPYGQTKRCKCEWLLPV